MNNLLRKGFQPVSETEMVMVDGGRNWGIDLSDNVKEGFGYRPPFGFSYKRKSVEYYVDFDLSFDFNERGSKKGSIYTQDFGFGRGNLDSVTFGVKIKF
ncbi:hypothetical protein [Treponema denticola]|uniref:hypothetical protein n=1 Tax=Treponema denticola TaxID=158 RepID=UPI0020A36BA7|nr:hypothetical protein [Treponema denticola]UTC81799.1 hypothetical protein HGJ18_00730 [Treponema denticola]